jgi:hypothetical protein
MPNCIIEKREVDAINLQKEERRRRQATRRSEGPNTHTGRDEQAISRDGGEADVMSHDNLKYITKMHLLSRCLPAITRSQHQVHHALASPRHHHFHDVVTWTGKPVSHQPVPSDPPFDGPVFSLLTSFPHSIHTHISIHRHDLRRMPAGSRGLHIDCSLSENREETGTRRRQRGSPLRYNLIRFTLLAMLCLLVIKVHR